ncbi:glycosyltransferase family 4 protein [Lacibacter sediminis]|uniref:Glycosyltransferase family 4 protein n=1 Tax=Lacibacter sediminis TaxID=2760713 RepID=A0A7G5XHR0_9BACT|nr:glycosyltransferase family 4 protein [Lacibacter sediminis]QNA45013.1 glycosyltransferase family 4 protein [Lacibacter sediminis]
MKRLAIITSHPIQYNAPLFRLLTERKRIAIKVFYTWGQTEQGFVYDPDFKKEFKWDIPLLEGYEAIFVENISVHPGAGHFTGIKNKDLIRQIDLYNPDALMVIGWSFQSHLQVLRHYKGRTKIIFRGDSNLLDEAPGFSIKKSLRRLVLKWVLMHIDVALYTGEHNRQYYIKHGVKQHQLVYAPNAVENQRFADGDAEAIINAKVWRRELGIPESSLVFLFAGKLESKKDPLLLINAFKSLPQIDIRLLLVGNGVLEKDAKQLAANDNRILFLDFQNQQQMPIVYRLGDVFVLPSKGPGETWGLSVNEAMACGRAVIVSDKCGCAADVVCGNGIVFEAENKQDLQRALLYFAENSIATSILGNKSSQVIKQFSHEQVATAIEQSI